MSDEQILAAVKSVLAKAREKHPSWPDDPIHGAAIVAEEAGELVQAALQHKYENGRGDRMGEEAFHVIATAIRFVAETQTDKGT